MTNAQEHVLVVISDPQASALFDRTLRSADYTVTLVTDGNSAVRQAGMIGATLVVLGERLRDGLGVDFAGEFARRSPALPLVMVTSQDSPDMLRRAMRAGVTETICPPLKPDEILRAVRSALDLNKRRKDILLLEARRHTSSLQRQVDEMETLVRLGHKVTSSLALDSVLAAIVDAAVELTAAEEGSLLLVDEATGDLYMRASRNFQDEFVRTFRLPITDSIAGAVIRSGEAILVDESTPQKIKTSYLVQSLLYVPLLRNGKVFGVLGVDNRQSHLPLTQKHVKQLSMLASYAMVALENARLFNETNTERNKLATILGGIQDGVVVIDQEHRLAMMNRVAREAFAIDPADSVEGKPFQELFKQEELLRLLNAPQDSLSNRTEISPDSSRVFSVQAAPIPEVGRVLALHDITYLKKLDRIKSDFVHTVSHDLRSPLTAILGYVELIERAGTVTDLQRDFIRRIQLSVHNITHLVDDLLDLGRIESGFDVRKETVRLEHLLRFAAESQKKQMTDKTQTLHIDLAEDVPPLLANPVQMRQLMDHLLENAIRYTPNGGLIKVTGRFEQDQVILQFIDNGMGIPAIDLPYIFDKFYRAANASMETSGTGLGLAIVKSIVENHGGRVWVESTAGQGSTFTIVLPVLSQ